MRKSKSGELGQARAVKTKRELRRRYGFVELVRHPAGFTLFERSVSNSSIWRTLKVCRVPRAMGVKNVWNLGWNGERLARNTEAKQLVDHEPEIYAWVIEQLTKA